VDDYENLLTVYKLLEGDFIENDIFQLSENHKCAIDEANFQIEHGEYYTNVQANQEINDLIE
jgi:hypothetical protein